ncbi:hypothetical protein SAMN05421803_12170 [Nocardiopsis flavescens]|uniref:Uncharacterized protein n=1 Tax=Nocardiopsis flavescens TaxID=758803 RepID=A0A1M6SXU7_9ACTN|nr:hypothetical protein [Nocardiopsis flavescens]SHK49541.1 hypothetical protein SAMN05421803_12170 [Nocardiopsis flavescens]
MTQHSPTGEAPPPGQIRQPRFHRPDPDLAAAMECVRCHENGVFNPPGWPPKPPERREGPPPPTPHPNRDLPLTLHKMEFLREVWAYVASKQVGSDPDARYLALVCALRGAIRGKVYLLGQDMRILRLEDPHAALGDLISSGWLVTTPERVIESHPSDPALCDLPDIEDNPWDIGQGVRSRASGWVGRAMAHKKMRKKPNRLRLTGAYLASRAEPGGRIRVPRVEVTVACALSGPDELTELLAWLERIEWITPVRDDGAVIEAELGETTAWLAPVAPPPPTPPRTSPATTPLQAPVGERADALLGDRAAEVGRWVDGYRSDHGHGPSWSTVAEHFGWPPRSAPDHDVTQEIFERLGRRGVLTGFGVPFGLRPGAALSREDAA